MAARKRRGTKDNPMQDEWKDKIRASAIINRLVGCINGEIELNPQQVKAADVVLKKIVPDLARSDTTITGANGGPLQHEINVTISPEDAYKRLLND